MIFLFVGDWVDEGFPGSLMAREIRTLRRSEDYVAIRGSKFKRVLNYELARFSLMAYKDGKLVPIPFQIDEVDPEGDWVLDSIPTSFRHGDIKLDRDFDEGRFDENDELVFVLKDSGDRLPAIAYPSGVLAMEEIFLVDPLDGGKAWAYVGVFPENPQRSDRVYVHYDPENDRVSTPNYIMGFFRDLVIAPTYTTLALWEAKILLTA